MEYGRRALVAAFTSGSGAATQTPNGRMVVAGNAPPVEAPPPKLMPWETAMESMPRLHLLVVDPDPDMRGACGEIAERMGFAVESAAEINVARRMIENHKVDVLLLDLKMPEGRLADAVADGHSAGGLALLDEVKAYHPEIAVVAMTSATTVSSAVEAMRRGAKDYLTKPFALEELVTILERESRKTQTNTKSRMLREHLRNLRATGPLIGSSPEMEKLYRILAKVAHSSHPVLILGAPGTGKELVARQIHFNGLHSSKPFTPVDCGAVIPAALEGELFGYVKGAMPGRTGATPSTAKDGILSSAEGGTVFLKDIGQLPLDLQAKLMRTLQERIVRPVGGTHTVPLSVRVLAATSADLAAMVEQGRFRRDLYFRLNVVSLRTPALAQRKEDIPELAQYFLEKIRRELGVAYTLSDDALRVMLAYDWPDNVRELERAIEYATAISSEPTVRAGSLPTELRNLGARLEKDGEVKDLVEVAVGRLGSERIQSIAELERNAILDTIKTLRGDKLLAARLLGIGKTTLYRKLKEYGIQEWGDSVGSSAQN